MKQRRLNALCSVFTVLFGMMFTVPANAQETSDDAFGLDAGISNNVTVESADDGSWTVTTLGDDPYVASTPLNRDLTEAETTLTFEYKISELASVDFFFSKGVGTTFENARSIHLGNAPATDEWTRVYVDITKARTEWEWGGTGTTLRLDCGNASNVVFQIRDLRICSDPVNKTEGFKLKDGAIQLDSQAEFDKWVAAMKGFVSYLYLPDFDVDLLADVKAASTEGSIIEDFRAKFNGHNHVIDLDLNVTFTEIQRGMGFFRQLHGATVENVSFTGSVRSNTMFMGSAVSEVCAGSVVRNISSNASIISDKEGDGTHGGVIGRITGFAKVRNIMYSGKFYGENTHSCGGVIGWMDVKSDVQSILMTGDMTELQDLNCNTVARNPLNMIPKRIYATVEKNQTPDYCTIVTEEQIRSGEVCFALNGDQTDIAWYQTIGTDAVPTLDNTHKQVFAEGYFSCDGTPQGDATYSNEGTNSIPEHSYTNGICDVCDHMQDGYVTNEDGWYIVDTPEKLVFMAKYATAYPYVNMRITQDLDMSDASDYYEPIRGAWGGTLDGMGHTISNLIISRPQDRDMALVGLAGGCTIKNLTLDAGCSIEGAGYSAGFVGETTGSVTITLENLFMHGDVVGNGPNAAGIYACNMGSSAQVVMTNCGHTGTVAGARESGLMTGWFGSEKATLKGCWSVGSVTGCDSDPKAVFARPGGGKINFSNCWSAQGERSGVGKVNADAAVTGELTWKLNGSTFVNPSWFQNLEEEDPYPTLDSSRGVVYPTVDGYATVFADDPESFAAFKKAFTDLSFSFKDNEDVVNYATVSLVEEYIEILETYSTASDMPSFVEVYLVEQAKKKEIEASIKAYKAYENAAAEIMTILADRTDFEGPDRDFLENEYLGSSIAPGENEKAPNGSFEYIMENRQLIAKEVEAETEYLKELLRIAVSKGYAPGTDITNALVNANFAEGFTGWKGKLFTSHQASPTEGSNMHAAEYLSTAPADMYQEIVVAKKGVYELQVRGVYRGLNDPTSTQLYPYIYLNGNANYLQSAYEGMILVEDAIDGVNCNLTGSLADMPIVDENNETIGYALHGLLSCNKAFEGGRCDNRILINVPNDDDTLRVGINVVHSDFGSNEWTGIGDIHLTYWGDLAESEEALDRTLESMVARAKTVLKTPYSSDEDYYKYPNFSQDLKDRVAAAITQAENAADANAKYAVIEEFSTLFKEIIDCKKAYKKFFAEVEKVVNHAFIALTVDPENCTEIANNAAAAQEEAMNAYNNGTLSTEEALMCDIVKNIGVVPVLDENGVYHISSTAQYSYFTTICAGTDQPLNVVLDGDVCMNTPMIITDFRGVFDGQDHTLTINIERTANAAAPIENLRGGAIVKNLIVRGSIKTNAKFAASVAAHSYDASKIERVQSYVAIEGSIAGDGTHGGILAVNDGGAGQVNNCVFAGTMSGASNSNGGIVGWSCANGSQITGCLVIAQITADPVSSNVIGRNGITAKDCYYVTPYGAAPATGATQVTEEQLMNGFATYGLNGGCTHKSVAWRQNLDGSDIVPTLDPTHKVVYMTADSVYTNEIQNEIEKYTGTEDDPYILNTAQDLALLRRFLFPGRVNYVQLGADIDMASLENWIPLNMDGDRANGKNYQNIIDFDGKNHVISNFTCTDETQHYNSFFGILNGSVRNVGFKDANVSCSASGSGILAGYMGHNDYRNDDETKTVSRLENVWVSGKLNVAGDYAGGFVGNIGGPSVIKNCYSNIEVTSEADYVGGLVGRVRDQLSIDQAYAAGSIVSAGENVGGIVGGGQNVATTPAYYNNIVVWNNTDKNFGHIVPATDMTLPEADLMDLVFNEDGTVQDRSIMQHNVEVVGTPKISFNEEYSQYTLKTESNGNSTTPVSFLKVDYAENEAFKQAMMDGFTIEATVAVRNTALTGTIKPFCATQSGGFGFEILNNGQFRNLVYTQLSDGTKGYRNASTGVYAKMDTYYHMIGSYDKTNGKISIYINGGNKVEGSAAGDLLFPANAEDQWIGVGADVGVESGANFEILNARIYDEPMSEDMCKAIYLKQKGIDFYAGDRVGNISYYDGTNFAALQQVVVDWGKPWQCDMQDGSYPTFDGTLADGIQNVTGDLTKGKVYNINGIRVEKTTKGIYIIDGKKVVVK